ncbi:oligosaccharide flippase family protein [Negadavirga shengliensis]|uniref:Oligosaccharide flippase family protein n=1 Tax=Negadavirga shengliensis TaxID=1389218 RepID=A0ABV9T2Z6_9BACT
MLKRIIQHKVFKNFSYLTIGSVLSQLISLLTVLKITKVLHPDDYGLYTFMIAQGTLLLTIGDLGIRNIVIRSIARDPNRTNDLVFNGAILRMLALTLLSAIYLVYNYYLGNLNIQELVFVFSFALISCFGKLFETAFLGHQKMLTPSLINLGFSVSWFLCVYLLPASNMTVEFLFYSFLGINLLKNAAFYFSLQRQHLLKGKVLGFWHSSQKLLKESWPYFALVLVMLPFTKLSNNFLDINSSIEQIGFFNLSERLTGPVSFVLDFALVAIFPNLSALWVSNKVQFRNFVREGFKYYMLLGMILCFLFTLYAKELFGLLFPENYMPAVMVCQLQIWYLYLTSIDSLIGTILGATNNEKKILKLGIVNSLFSTPILYISSSYGALGLASGMVISFSCFQFYLWYLFGKTLKIKVEDKGRMWIIAALLFVFSYFIAGNFDFVYKVLFGLLSIAGTGFYFSRNYSLAKA